MRLSSIFLAIEWVLCIFFADIAFGGITDLPPLLIKLSPVYFILTFLAFFLTLIYRAIKNR